MNGKKNIVPNHDGVPDARGVGGRTVFPERTETARPHKREKPSKRKVGQVIERFGVTDKQRERILKHCSGKKYPLVRRVIEQETQPKERPLALSYCASMSGMGIIANSAVVVTSLGEELREATVAPPGEGAVSATCKAIRGAVKIDFRLTDYLVRIESGNEERRNEDSSARVIVELECDGKLFVGTHCSTDVIQASAIAILDALNRYVSYQTWKKTNS